MDRLVVVALCAEWCGVCREFRQQWDGHDFSKSTDVSYHWVDIEDRQDLAGDLEVETFPCLAVFSGSEPVFFGPVQPHMGMLERVSQAPAAQRLGPDARAALLTLYAGLLDRA